MEKHQGYFFFTGLILSAITHTYGGLEIALTVLFFQGLWFLHLSKEKIDGLQRDLHEAELVIRELKSGSLTEVRDYEFKSIFSHN